MAVEDLYGAWLLEATVFRYADGNPVPNAGGQSRGQIMYDPAGRMSA
jgi:hypothetical protein